VDRTLKSTQKQLERSVSRLERALDDTDTSDNEEDSEDFDAKQKKRSLLLFQQVYRTSHEATKTSAKQLLRGTMESDNLESVVGGFVDLLDAAKRQFEALYARTGALQPEAEWATRTLRLLKSLKREVTKQQLFCEYVDLGPELRAAVDDALRDLYESVCVCAKASATFATHRRKRKRRALDFVTGTVFQEKLLALREDVDAAVEDMRAQVSGVARTGGGFADRRDKKFMANVLRHPQSSVKKFPELQAWLEKAAAGGPASGELRETTLRAIEFLCLRGDADLAARTLSGLPPLLRSAPRTLLVKGAIAYLENRVDDAVEVINDAVDKDANDPDLWFALGVCLRRRSASTGGGAKEDDQEDHDEEVAAYERCLALNPRHSMAHTYFGSCLLKRGDVDGAERELKIAIDLDSSNAAAHNEYGSFLASERRDFDEAEVHYRKSLEEAGKTGGPTASARNNYASLLMNVREQIDDAEEMLLKALDEQSESPVTHNSYGLLLKNFRRDFDKAELHYRKALDLDPSYADAHNNLAILLKTVKNDIDGAEKHYRLALSSVKGETSTEDADAYNNLAHLLHTARHDYDQAEHYYRLALKADPSFATAHNNYANLLTDVRGDNDAGERHLRLALKANPSYADAHNSLGYFLHVVRQDYEQAERHYRSALTSDPNHASAHANYGLLLHVVRQSFDVAEFHYREAIKADPSCANAYNNLGYLLLSARREPDAAEAQFRKGLKADPDHAATNESYADLLYSSRSNFDLAEVHFRKALKANPNRATAHERYGELLMDVRHDYDSALIHLEKAVALCPKTKPGALKRLSRIYEQKGALPEAKDYLRRYLALQQDDEDARDKLLAAEFPKFEDDHRSDEDDEESSSE